MSEIANWSPDRVGALFLRRSIQPEVTCATPFPYVLVTHQGDIETAFEAGLDSKGLKIEHRKEIIHYTNDTSTNFPSPLIAYVRDNVSGVIEVWHTKYILGCDGAGSIVRHIAGAQMHAQGS